MAVISVNHPLTMQNRPVQPIQGDGTRTATILAFTLPTTALEPFEQEPDFYGAIRIPAERAHDLGWQLGIQSCWIE